MSNAAETANRRSESAGSTGRDRVIIFDTTLRDGEQSPGASMNLEEKLKIASVLEGMGVDVIEAGFPIASNGDFEAVNEIAKRVTESTVCGLSRAGRKDIDRAWEALRPRAEEHTSELQALMRISYAVFCLKKKI